MHTDFPEQQPLASSVLIELWEAGLNLPRVQRTLHMLHAGYPTTPREEWKNSPLGHINRALIRLHTSLYGWNLHLFDRCPECREGVEFQYTAENLASTHNSLPVISQNRPFQLNVKKWLLTFCLPTLMDWDAAADTNIRPEQAGQRLLERCLLTARRNSRKVSMNSIPAEIWEALALAVSEHDPLSEILFNIQCPKCSHKWESILEPADCLWREISTTAQRLLHQIHLIARAYGWSEASILSLSPERRNAYFALIEESAATGFRHAQSSNYSSGALS